MLAAFLFGALLAVLTIDRLSYFVALIPWIYDYIYFSIFSRKENLYDEDKLPANKITKIEAVSYPYIPQCLDDALTELVENIYNSYMVPVSKAMQLSDDVDIHLRKLIRTFVSSIYKRAISVKFDEFVHKVAIPKFLAYSLLFEKANSTIEEDDIYFNEKAIFKRVMERDQVHCSLLFEGKGFSFYYDGLSEAILNETLPDIKTTSRPLAFLLRSILNIYLINPLIETLSEPKNIYSMIFYCISLEKTSETLQTTSSNTLVPLLHRVINDCNKTFRPIETPPKVFRISWKHLYSNPSLFYIFMQVLKRSSGFKFPPFCLALESITKKINQIKLNEKGNDSLIREILTDALNIHQVFIKSSSNDTFEFSDDLVEQFTSFNYEDQSIENVKTLSTNINYAYKTASDMLTQYCLDTFYRSPEFFMLCLGDRPQFENSVYSFHAFQSRKEYGMYNNNSCSHDNAERSCDDESYKRLNKDYTFFDSDESHLSDHSSMESNNTEQTPTTIDISQWIIEIKNLKNAWKKNSKIVQFVITVTNPNLSQSLPNKWEVDRQYKEFYGLENRLKRFHGDRITTSLPARRSMLPKSFEFFNSCLKPFQNYIQNLLKNPYLKHSSMVYAFLTRETIGSASYFSKSISMDTGRAIQSVIGTLSVEKGKYIDKFINDTFFTSTELPKPKVAKKIPFPKLKHKLSFLSKHTVSPTIINKTNWTTFKTSENNIIYLFIKSFCEIFSPTRFLSLILHLFYTLFGSISELLFIRWLSEKIKILTVSRKISLYIRYLNSLVCSSQSLNEPEINQDDLIQLIYSKIPAITILIFGEVATRQSIKKFVKLFQLKTLNKQLICSLLDDFISLLIPELTSNRASPTNSIST